VKGTQLGPYLIEGELASGGMATVWVATHTRLGHVVAIKSLHPHYQKDEQLRSRFVDEARIQANLRHPNILTVHDILELREASGMVMELLIGCSLNTYYRAAGTPLPLPQVLKLFISLAGALHHAHAENVVHRDLKPSNIFLHIVQKSVVPKLMDFGVAKFESHSMANRLTATGTLLGTPHYMAPGQFEDSSSVDRRADLFSLGVMLYEATTGMLPFEGKSITSIMREILTHQPIRPRDTYPDFPHDLEEIITRCLQKRREHRFRSAAELEKALSRVASRIGLEEFDPDRVPVVSLEDRGIEVTSIGTLTEDESSIWTDTETREGEDAKGQEGAGPEGGVGTVLVKVPTGSPIEVDWEGTQVSRVRSEQSLGASATIPGYRITEKIYEGSETLVFRGVNLDDESIRVIIKVLNEEYPGPNEIARLKHEYAILNSLQVEGVPRVIGLERYRNGLALLLEDVGARSLREELAAGALPVDVFLPHAIRLAEILGYLHARSVIHKDINPKNIVLHTQTGQLQLIDFGLATVLLGQHEEAQANQILEGTLAYISPEQTGRMNRPVDHRTDFYSLGVTFFEMLCGKTPFDTHDRAELVHCHLAKQPPSPHELDRTCPVPLSDLIMKLMAKNAEDRYQSARGLSADLAECARQLSENGNIDSFTLGDLDISDRFQIPRKLYGRDQQVEQLLEAFSRVSQGYKEMLLVLGHAGVGKTSLVQEVYKPITRRRGYFITGKFDQYKRDIPYGALIEAFQGLVKELLTENENEVQQWRSRLLQALGNNAQVIIDVIPEVELIIGVQAPVPELPATESLNRLNLMFNRFTNVFAAESHPLVIFLDDLQWADTASLNLMHVLMTGSEHQFLFLIGAYRHNEVEASHPLRTTIEDISKTDTEIHRVELAPLSLPHINQLVADTLNCTLQDALSLAELLETKTGGNPFFMGEFLKSLHERHLILFNMHNGAWEWETGRIQAEAITDNVVDLMAEKINQLRPSSQQALKLAACVGNQFDLQTLGLVSGKPPGGIINALTEAVSEGLILLLGDAYKYLELESDELADGLLDAVLLQTVKYRFAHDKIQQAAYSLIPEEARQRVHRQIGLLVLSDTPAEKKLVRIFDIVNQLNEGLDLARSREEREELARLNLRAGQRAKSSGAYRSSYHYLNVGISLLQEECWKEQYELSLSLHEETAEAAYLCTEFAVMEEHVATVLESATELQHKIRVYETSIQGDIARSLKMEAITTGLTVLRELGIGIPIYPKMAHVLWALVRTRTALLGKKPADLIDLPAMTDERILTAVRIATKINSTAYVVSPNLFPVLVLKQVELSVKYGNADVSPFGYALYGTILCGVLGNISTGYSFGQMALKLSEKSGIREFMPRTGFTVAATSQHFREPLRETLQPLLGNYRMALENGDLEFGGCNSGVYVYYVFFSGKNLVEARDEMTFYAEVLEQIKQEAYLRYIKIYLQVCANLLHESKSSWILDGEHFKAEELSARMREQNDGHGFFNANFMRAYLAFLHEDYAQALKWSREAREVLFSAAAMFPFMAFHFYETLICIACCESDSENDRGKHLKRIRKNLKLMKKWAEHGPENHAHKWHIVQAEYSRIRKRNVAAMEHYDKAIEMARGNGFIQEEALGCELAGRFYLGIGKKRIASAYLTDAYHRYYQWGATAKVKRLEKQYRELLATAIAAGRYAAEGTLGDTSTISESTSTNTSSSSSDRLDIAAVIKASQLIAGEIHLEALLKQMTRIVVENAGAQRGLLILEQDDAFFVEAEISSRHDDVDILAHTPVRERTDIAQAVVNYVMRLKVQVVLDDAANQGNFSRDVYIMAVRPKSLLCLPLLHQNRLAGLLYLENNLATGAFTSSRLEILQMLTAEIVVSLENARLYDDLQRNNRILEVQVGERTHDLQEANRQLEIERDKSEKLLLNVLPERVAEELKQSGRAQPERFEDVTVLFSDFVGFTEMSTRLTPEELISELNEMFSAFDGIVTGNHCERIKTIGDAYLCVSGMPEPHPMHATNVVRAAREMVEYVQRRNARANFQWQLRIGIHTGPVVGAVVGIQKYIYDVFGDTINTASRMESHSEPMRINLSEVTAALISDEFKLEERPVQTVKGKGDMKMFFVG
jgi:predicted ATPase/serine/threonine protein kinase/class 3 adenylate cyclase